jgi:hypothetical protein
MWAVAGQAATINVTNANLSGAGSLPEAITTANSNGEADTIVIAVTPVYSVTLPFNLPRITESGTTIDATGTFALIDGSSSTYNAFHLDNVTACTIRNFTVAGANYGVLMSGGSGNQVVGCKLENNTRPVYLNSSNSNTVSGCQIIANTNGIILNESSLNTIGGITALASNRISGNAGNGGIYIFGLSGNGNIIRGNRIGLNSTGDGSQANITGITIFRGSSNIIGGTSAGAGNYISGNSLYGIRIRQAQSQANSIQGNFIGLAEDGVASVPNGSHGVFIQEGSDLNQIGGSAAGQANTIQNNLFGVTIDGSATLQNTISRNNITSNTSSGIRLTNSGNSAIAAPTLLRPNPVLGLVATEGTVELFVDDAAQGETFVGAVASADGGFLSTVNLLPYEGRNLTATVTSATGNTSQFSAPILIDVTPPIGLALIGGSVVTDPVVIIGLLAADNYTLEDDLEMRFSNDGGLTWTAWEPFDQEKTWDLNFGLSDTSDGFRNMSAQFRDASLNESLIYSDTVELDTTGPQVLAFEQLDPTPTQLASVRYRLAFDEPVVGLETGVAPSSDDFAVSTLGTLTLTTISEISDDGGNEYTLTISTGDGDGLIDLELLSSGGIEDDHGNPLAAGQEADTYAIDRLAIVVQPEGGNPTEGDPFSMSIVSEGGIGPIHHVWYKNGVPIVYNNPDAPQIDFQPAILFNTGEYTVEVSDDYVSVLSDPAYLDVQIRFPALSGAGMAGLAAAMAAVGAWAARRRR